MRLERNAFHHVAAMALVATAAPGEGVDAGRLRAALGLSAHEARAVLDHLRRAGLILGWDTPASRVHAARSPGAIDLAEIVQCARDAPVTGTGTGVHPALPPPPPDPIEAILHAHALEALTRVTLAELIAAQGREVGGTGATPGSPPERTVGADALRARLDTGAPVTLLDLRARTDPPLSQRLATVALGGDELDKVWPHIPREGLVVAVCPDGARSYVAVLYLEALGLTNARAWAGGVATWPRWAR